uniref:Uncharacterized protein n=1 Tax=Rhodosorus marinus TaxID=101924 RepID=A0A6T6KMQ2_9RHOD|mmetsp:Transcript_13001/g.18707  ORF Transcript_13001/g.18707 Transcript_13001/m.18707 type:complete len:137 (+) Transcript_13001:266-676(+)
MLLGGVLGGREHSAFKVREPSSAAEGRKSRWVMMIFKRRSEVLYTTATKRPALEVELSASTAKRGITRDVELWLTLHSHVDKKIAARWMACSLEHGLLVARLPREKHYGPEDAEDWILSFLRAECTRICQILSRSI